MISKKTKEKSLPLTEHSNLHKDEYTWSLVSPLPVIKYLPKHDDYIVYWNGVVMPHLTALNIAMRYFGIYPSPTIKHELEKNYNRLYYAGAFGDRQWDYFMNAEWSDTYKYLNNIMHLHLHETLKDKTPVEVLSWFNYKNAK